MSEIRRNWIFCVTDLEEEIHYLAADGLQIDEETAKEQPFIAISVDAAIEADARADRWEDYYNRWASKITYISQGIAEKSPMNKG